MPRPAGLLKTGGRQKGTPNKRTEAFVLKLDELNLDVLEEIVAALPELPTEKRVQILIALLPYRYSKASSEVEVQLSEVPLTQLSDEELDARYKALVTKLRIETNLASDRPIEDIGPAQSSLSP